MICNYGEIWTEKTKDFKDSLYYQLIESPHNLFFKSVDIFMENGTEICYLVKKPWGGRMADDRYSAAYLEQFCITPWTGRDILKAARNNIYNAMALFGLLYGDYVENKYFCPYMRDFVTYDQEKQIEQLRTMGYTKTPCWMRAMTVMPGLDRLVGVTDNDPFYSMVF